MNMQDIPKLSRRQLWMRARGMRDFATSESLARAFLDKRPEDVAAARGLVRDLTQTGRAHDALDVWRLILKQEPSDIESAYHLWLNDPDDLALSELSIERRGVLERAHRFRMAEGSAPPCHHVAICGVSFCGSTLFDRMLGGLPDVASIGESHWLTKQRHDRSYTPLSLDSDIDNDLLVPCSVCGHNCEVLSHDFRLALAADKTDWYQRIGVRLGELHLVSADKNLPKLVDNDPFLRFDAIVLFKSPDQAWWSQLTKMPEGDDPASYRAALEKHAEAWVRTYHAFLHGFRPQGSVVFLNFDAFTEMPEPYLRAVCEKVGLPYSSEILSRTKPGHAIGGNRGSMKHLRDRDYALQVMPLPPADMPEEHRAYLDAHELVQDTYRQLMAWHESLLRPVGGVVRNRVIPFDLPDVREHHLTGIFGRFEDVVSDAIAESESRDKPGDDERARFYRYLLDRVDVEAYGRLQEEQLSPPTFGPNAPVLKYIDPIRWFDARLRLAELVGLKDRKPMRILDLGSGPGHWGVVAEFYGHKVMGTDLPTATKGRIDKGDLYDKMHDLFGLERIPLRIKTGVPLPDLGGRYDMVTAFLTLFNIKDDRSPWGTDQWDFFMSDLRDNQLSECGEVFMKLNAGHLPPDVWTYLIARAAFHDEKSKAVHWTDLSRFPKR